MRWLVVVFLGACAYPSETYLEDYAVAWCDVDARCALGNWSSVESCEAALRNDGPAEVQGCLYDAGAARDCIAELDDFACPAGGVDAVWPQACRDAFVDCPG